MSTRARPLVRRRPFAVLVVFATSLIASCAFGPQVVEDGPPTASVYVNIVDERGAPLPGAELELVDTHGERVVSRHRADHEGVVRLALSDPVVVVATADGRLDEPAVVGPDDNGLTIALWDRRDAAGRQRVSMHFGGDVMLGRRYLEPALPTASAHDAASARSLVRHLAPLTERADWTVVNLESVVGDLPDELALDGKGYPLRSAPFAVDALEALGVDLVTLGNDHTYDWGTDGLAVTFAALDAAGIAHVGAGSTPDEAIRGWIDDVAGITIGTISVTTIDGDEANDRLPDGDDVPPAGLSPTDAWRYEPRRFGFDGHGVTIPVAERRAGEAWRWFAELEPELSPTVSATLWAALTEVYPELQDWVARRGHGGAAWYRADDVEAEIARLRAEGADLVVLQLHGGFQFADVASATVRAAAQRAIDAGADLVVGHHPHVLQGAEWYGEGLIVHSLGNLLFDQDSMATFSSAVLRVITDGEQILQARLLPVVLDRYRPKPAAGSVAAAIVRLADASTALGAVSGRVAGGTIETVLGDLRGDETSIRRDGNAGLVGQGRLATGWRETLVADETVELPACTLVRSDLLPDGVELGLDVLGWGHFGDDGVSGLARHDDGPDRRLPLMWQVPGDAARWDVTTGPTGTLTDRALRLHTDPNRTTTTRLLATVDLARHGLFATDGSPLDDPAALTVTMSIRRDRSETPVVRFVTFEFDPTTQPRTQRLAGVELPIEVPDDGRWHEVELPLPDELLEPDEAGRVPNKANLLVDAPPAVFGIVDLDDVRVVEWRGRTDADLPVWVAADAVRAASDGELELEISSC